MDRLNVIKMVVTRLPKLKLKSLSCKKNSNNSNQNYKLLPFKIRNFLSTYKKIRKKPMLKEPSASKKKSNVTFKEMKPINSGPIVKLISIMSCHSWIKQLLP